MNSNCCYQSFNKFASTNRIKTGIITEKSSRNTKKYHQNATKNQWQTVWKETFVVDSIYTVL